MAVQEKFYSADDLWALSHLPENDGKRFELDEGMLIEMSPAGGKHGGIAGLLLGFVWNFVRQYGLGYVTAAETGFILFHDPNGKDIVRAPDVGFIQGDRLPDGLPDGYIPFAPDLAIEVVSPNDEADEVQLKISQYLKHGTRLVWIAYPKSETVMVHTPTSVQTLDLDGVLDGGAVLPGFRLSVRDIFPER